MRLSGVAIDGYYTGPLGGMANQARAFLVRIVVVNRNRESGNQQRADTEQGQQRRGRMALARTEYHSLELYAGGGGYTFRHFCQHP